MPEYDEKTKRESSEISVEEDDELIYEGPDLEDIDLEEAIDTGALPVEDGVEDYGYEEDTPTAITERTADTPKEPEVIFAGLSPADWVSTLFIMRIPVVSTLYLIIHLISRKTTPVKRSFLKGYLYYKLIMLAVCVILLFIGVQVAAHYVEIALEYMKML